MTSYRLAVERQLTADDGWIAVELPRPEVVRQNRDQGPAELVLLLRVPAAERRLHAKDVEEGGRRHRALQPGRIAITGEREGGLRGAADRREDRVARLPVDVFGIGSGTGCARRLRIEYHHQLFRVRKRQRLEEHSVEDAEYGARDADSEGKGQHGEPGNES